MDAKVVLLFGFSELKEKTSTKTGKITLFCGNSFSRAVIVKRRVYVEVLRAAALLLVLRGRGLLGSAENHRD